MCIYVTKVNCNGQGGEGDIHGTLMRTSTFLKINTVEPCQKANASGQKRQRYTSFILRKERLFFPWIIIHLIISITVFKARMENLVILNDSY